MRRMIILLSLLACLSLTGAKAQERIKWYTIEEALQLTASEPKMLVIDVFTDWCGWCKRLDATTFSDPEVVSIMNQYFYPVKLDAEGKEDIVLGDKTYSFVDKGSRGYHELAAIVTRGRLSYPTISYVDAKGRIINAVPGYQGPDQFKVFLAYYRADAYKTQNWEEFRAAYTGTPD
jgi:thioredoxin-related protein